MEWYEAVEALVPHVFRIQTPQGSGTGFLASLTQTGDLCGVATAAHVIDHAHYWEQPIRIQHALTGSSILLRPSDRAVLLDESRDTAALVFRPENLQLPTAPVPLIDEGFYSKVGNPIGWLGYPAIAGAALCFFTGTISAWVQETSSYFVDGVAINGVSGGPAFGIAGEDMRIIGVVSAYMPNRVTGETLPGLGIIRDVFQFHEVLREFRSLDDAKESETPPPQTPPPAPPQPIPGDHSPTGNPRGLA